MEATAIVAAVVSVIGAVVSVVSARAQAEKESGDLYDQMVRFRTEHPEVMRMSREWKPGFFEKVYCQKNEDDRQWAVYYSYVELCLGYCNTVLSARHGWRLGRSSFSHHHGLLVKLLLTEHYPILEDLLRDGKYVSGQIKRFQQALSKEGWNWQEEHERLAS